MTNKFTKDVQVVFENLLPKFEDNLVLSNLVSRDKTNAKDMQRSGNVKWQTIPYISQAYDGIDATANMKSLTQLAVPTPINQEKHATFALSGEDMLDMTQEDKAGASCAQKLASVINQSVADTITQQGTLVVAQSTAATGYDDVALCDTIMNEQGVLDTDRLLTLSSSDYNAMAGNLAARETMNGKPTTAYEKALISGDIAGFAAYKQDWSRQIAGNAASSITINGAGQSYTPLASDSSGNLVDNRYQNLALTVGSGTLAVGDCFTIAGVNAVHHINKESTGSLKTFRVVSLLASAGATGTVQVSPPLISGAGGLDAELEYQNVDAAPANGAAVTILNTTTAKANPFWVRDSVVLTPGIYNMQSNQGVNVVQATTSNGIQITLTESLNDKTTVADYILRVRYGVTMLNPEMAGLILFNQA